MEITMEKYAVVENGVVDVDATVEKFNRDLTAYVAARETEASTIGQHVDAVFEQYKGQHVKMPTLVTFVLNKLNVQSENYSTLKERVEFYVRSNSAAKRDEAVSLGRKFVIEKGKGGGVAVVADLPVKESK
jgi:hypothetical protein